MLALTCYNSLSMPWLSGIKEIVGLAMYIIAVAASEIEAKMVRNVLYIC